MAPTSKPKSKHTTVKSDDALVDWNAKVHFADAETMKKKFESGNLNNVTAVEFYEGSDSYWREVYSRTKFLCAYNNMKRKYAGNVKSSDPSK